MRERASKPSGRSQYVGPVIVLQGQRTMSSAESFALMLAQCPQVMTMGDRTAGSSGNPTKLAVAGDVVVNLPRWVDYTHDGKPVDAVGIAPDITIPVTAEDFAGQKDTVLAAALKELRNRINSGETPEIVLQPRKLVPRELAELEAMEVDRPSVVSVFPPDEATDIEPTTEIRIRFDRPMDPAAYNLDCMLRSLTQRTGFRLRATPSYVAEKKEFVIPVNLNPDTTHELLVNRQFHEAPDGFCSIEGVAAHEHSWRFTTRKLADGVPAPRVLTVDPPSGSATASCTRLRVQFDKPVLPDCFDLRDRSGATDSYGPQIPFPVQYDPNTNTMTLHVLLPPNKPARFELCGFQGVGGGVVEPIGIEYRVGKTLLSEKEAKRIEQAGRSAKLREIVEDVREERRIITSMEESVHYYYLTGALACWSTSIRSERPSTFRFQGDQQFYADVSSIMKLPFRLGGDGADCWLVNGNTLTVLPRDSIDTVNVAVCDPFGLEGTTDGSIERLQLEYMGTTKVEGTLCHRIRSWHGEIVADTEWVDGIQDWLIDAETLLPVVKKRYATYAIAHTRFVYHKINEPFGEASFRPPATEDLDSKEAEHLQDGYTRFLRAIDGSGGRISVRWGMTDSERTVFSSGLN